MADYRFNIPNPIDTIRQNLSTGMAIQNYQQQQEDRAYQLQQREQIQRQAEAQREQAIRMQTELAEFANKPVHTAQDYQAIITKYPAMADAMRQGWDMQSEEQRSNAIEQATPIYAALNAGKPEIATDLIDTQIQAYEKAGDAEKVAGLKAYRKIIDANPDAAKTTAGLMMASVMKPEEFANTITKLEESRATVGKTEAETAKLGEEVGLTKAQTRETNARAAKLGYESAKIIQEIGDLKNPQVELSADAEKLLNKSAQDAVIANNLAVEYDQLAQAFDNDIAAGAMAQAEEKAKGFFGEQDKVTALRQEYLRLRNSAVLQMLPPGVASDKDIEIALSAFPKDTANPELLSSFLKGLSKLKKYEAQYNQAQADWINQVGNLGRARRDTDIMGVDVKAGTTFNSFVKDAVKFEGKNSTQQPKKQSLAEIFGGQ